jgi:hypothetical protein
LPSIARDGVHQVTLSPPPSPDVAPIGCQWVFRFALGRFAADFENGAHGAAFRCQLHSSDDHGEWPWSVVHDGGATFAHR